MHSQAIQSKYQSLAKLGQGRYAQVYLVSVFKRAHACDCAIFPTVMTKRVSSDVSPCCACISTAQVKCLEDQQQYALKVVKVRSGFSDPLTLLNTALVSTSPAVLALGL